MKKFEDFTKGIQKDITISDTVNERFEETLHNLAANRRKTKARLIKAASIAASFVLISTIFLASNPVFASKLLSVGNIFKKVENNISYSGKYDKKQNLSKEKTPEAILSTEDKNIKIAASEVYSDGFSVFVTLKMTSEKYDFSTIDKLADTHGQSINLLTSYGMNQTADQYDYDILFEGINKGKNTFIGMTKFNKEDYSLENGFVHIHIRGIYLDDLEINGSWKLKVPYETDRTNGKEIVVNRKAENGLTVKKLFVSPYQLAVLSDIPYTMPYKDKTDEDIIKQFHNKVKKTDQSQIEDIRNIKEYDFYEIAVFDQSGNRLIWEEVMSKSGELRGDLYSIRGKDVTKVHIFLTQKEDNMFELVKAKTEKEAKKKSELDFWVDIK